MKDQKIQHPPVLTMLFLSWFYTGKSPKAPGTAGSLASIPLIILIDYLHTPFFALFGLIFILFGLAVALTEQVQNKLGVHDPQRIVIDEVIGMLITWCFVQSTHPLDLLITFICFRLFDIIKIWPASYFDRMKHGFGTITDDVVSAIYAGIFALIIRNLF